MHYAVIAGLLLYGAGSFVAGARYGRKALAEEQEFAAELGKIKSDAEKRLASVRNTVSQFKKDL